MAMKNRKLTPTEIESLLHTLQERFGRNMERHPGIVWAQVQAKLEAQPEKLLSLHEMERTGGEPDVIAYGQEADAFVFFDCSPESPDDRRNLCYDHEALVSRKANKPCGSALEMAADMGIEILTEDAYRALQQFGAFDLKSSSWVLTPPEIRQRGGALFCDRRYDHVFTYHNGAESYYGARGFRGMLRV